MGGLFAGTPLERPVTCEVCEQPLESCRCPRGADGKVLLPSDQRLVVRVQRRARGKVVTTVEGLDAEASDPAALLKMLKGRCGAGGTVREATIEIQGDHRDAIAAALSDAGYPVG